MTVQNISDQSIPNGTFSLQNQAAADFLLLSTLQHYLYQADGQIEENTCAFWVRLFFPLFWLFGLSALCRTHGSTIKLQQHVLKNGQDNHVYAVDLGKQRLSFLLIHHAQSEILFLLRFGFGISLHLAVEHGVLKIRDMGVILRVFKKTISILPLSLLLGRLGCDVVLSHHTVKFDMVIRHPWFGVWRRLKMSLSAKR
jgi:hypothetical protein